ncbi:MAG TPA: hypothetical protein VGD48_35745, partial [Kutzneria sp.]
SVDRRWALCSLDMIKWRKCGDGNPAERVGGGRNEGLDVPLTSGDGDRRRSAERRCNLDTVGVTGSIPVSPTSMFQLVRRLINDLR